MKKKPREKKEVTIAFSAIALLVLVAFIAVMLGVAKAPIVVVMLFSWLVMFPFAMYLGYSPAEIEQSALDLIRPSVGVMTLMIAVGGMVSIWLCAGTVPSMIYWGLRIISPGAFLLVAFIVTSVVSLPTGTSWGTVATVGVAMMGVGIGLGLPSGLVAGAIISGAYFGNGFSPVSDAPLMLSSVLNINVWDHIKHMGPTTGIAWGLSAILYAVLGIRYAGAELDLGGINEIMSALGSLFRISWVTLIPMVVVLVMMTMRFSALLSILVGSVVGVLVSVCYQGFALSEVVGFMNSGFSIQSDNAIVSSLLNRGGFGSMYELVAIIIGSLGIGGILKGTGMLDMLISSMGKSMTGIRRLTVVTTIASLVTTAMIGTYYFCMTFVGTLMPPLYKKAGFKPENVGRTINNIANCFVAFLPWNAGALYMSSQLGVPIIEFVPYIFFNYLIIIIDFIFGFFAIGAKRYTAEEMAVFAEAESAGATAPGNS